MWVWELVRLKQDGLRPPLAILQLQFVLFQEMCEDEFDLMTGNRSSRARVPARSKLHLFPGEACQLEFLLILRGSVSELVEAQTVKGLGIWIDCGVEVDCIGRRK